MLINKVKLGIDALYSFGTSTESFTDAFDLAIFHWMSHPHGAVRCVQPVRVSGETVAKSCCKEKQMWQNVWRPISIEIIWASGQTFKLKAISIGDIKFFEMSIKWLFSSYLCCLLTTLRLVKRLPTYLGPERKSHGGTKDFPLFPSTEGAPNTRLGHCSASVLV